MPAPVNVGRGHRFAAYPRCSADYRGCAADAHGLAFRMAWLSGQCSVATDEPADGSYPTTSEPAA